MTAMKRGAAFLGAASAAILAVAALALPADAQERKSLRWTTAQVGSYGYTVAASMAKVLEQALGGEYTVTVAPYQSPTVSMKAVMDGDRSEEHTSELQSLRHLVCRLLLV